MRRSTQAAAWLLTFLVGAAAVALLLAFLAPSLAYRIGDRIAERLSGGRGRTFKIALGVRTGSYYTIGTILNRYLQEQSGYSLELVETVGVPETVSALLDPARGIQLATIDSSSEEASRAPDIYGLATIGRQYFFVIVPNDSAVTEFRDLRGDVNPGSRNAGQPASLGERVLDYYGLLSPQQTSSGAMPPAVSIVRPRGAGIARDFEDGHMQALTRTQFLHSDLLDDLLATGRYRLVPIRDHDALARALPGTHADFIPAGAYGPSRRIPPEPVATLGAGTLIVARGDLPGRVVSDILRVVYDPRFARDIKSPIDQETGRKVGDFPLHRAADLYYHRNDLPTSDLIGRVSFILTLIAGGYGALQVLAKFKGRNPDRANRE